MDPRPATRSRSILVKWMGIEDANSVGFVHGGTVMYLCDEAAGLAAVRHSGRRCVTAAMDRMTFLLPVHVGELLTLESSVNAAWRTSVEVGVRVTAENVRSGAKRHTSTAYLTMVALDDDGRPVPVPPLSCATDDERRREREAQLRRANRLAERDEILRGR
ncbi:MAG: thioesterase superfamily protein [Solirubrobacterales bacterium]|jgi:acyl-CoA hydrolase|nr:thioesterase superfamily protein [Solirubrobacterales bacterium]